MDNQVDDYNNIESSDVYMEHIYSDLDNSQSGNTNQTTNVENVLCFRKCSFCLLVTIIGIVCAFIFGLAIGLVVHPFLISKVDPKRWSTEIQLNKSSDDCENEIQFGMKSNLTNEDGKSEVPSNISCEQPCNINDDYLVDGGWGQWKQIGSCSVTCGSGLVPIVRTCDNPVPSNNGKYCSGKHHSLGTCIKEQCTDDKNLALKKETEQISTISPRMSSLAVDGNLTTRHNWLCAHTKHQEFKAWWAVDLGDLYFIRKVVIYGRTDCCTDRLRNFDIDIFKSRNTNTLEFSNFQDGIKSHCYYQSGEVPNHVLNASCPPGTNGQFVRVQLRGQNSLTLCEVEVYGTNIYPTRLTDFEVESPYSGPEVNIVGNTTMDQCRLHCSEGSSGSDCVASYSRQRNSCTVIVNSTTNL